MRVVDVGNSNPQGDIEEGRKILRAEIEHPSQSVMIVRGATPEVSRFVDLASVRSDAFPWRAGVWVRNSEIFQDDEENAWFSGHDEACAVILSLNDDPVEWLGVNDGLGNIEMTWLSAEGHA